MPRKIKTPDMITHKEVWYCRTEQGARDLANGEPTSSDMRIVKYDLGYAVQAGPSGQYMGPGCLNPKPWGAS